MQQLRTARVIIDYHESEDSMTAPGTRTTHTLRWSWLIEHGLLMIDPPLLRDLSWPTALRIAQAADGLILTGWEDGLDASGDMVRPVVYEHPDLGSPVIELTSDDARTIGLEADRSFMAWAKTDEDSIYAVPMAATPEPAPAGMLSATVFLRPREAQILEQLALEHGVRMTDILTAFACDLAGAHAASDRAEERFGGRSGGGDERLFAREWFERNRDPGGPSGDRPQFMRRFSAASEREAST